MSRPALVLSAIFAALLVATPWRAADTQGYSNVGGTSGVLVGTSPTKVIDATGTFRRSLLFYNQSTVATITVCASTAVYNGSAVVPAPNAPGCYTLNPNGGSLSYPSSGYVPRDAFYAVASAANAALTVEAH